MKIIIFTASTGGGHKRAAAAIEAKIKAVSPDTKVKVIDAMKTIGRVYDKTVCDGYHLWQRKFQRFTANSIRLPTEEPLCTRLLCSPTQ